MILDNDILQDFAKVFTEKPSKSEKAATVKYGTVTSVSGKVANVKLDGVPEGSSVTTPATMAMDAAIGDRVTVMIRNHKAVVTGNVSAPATAQDEGRYMKTVNGGLMIGPLDINGNPTGTYVMIEPTRWTLRNQNGSILALLYQTGFDFANGSGSFQIDNNTLIFGGSTDKSIRSLTSYGGETYIAEILVSSNDLQPCVELSISNTSGMINKIVIDENGVKINEAKIVTSGNIMVNGAIKISRTIPVGMVSACASVVNVPAGYQLAGIQSITIVDKLTEQKIKDVSIEGFYSDISLSKVCAYVKNNGANDKYVTAIINWFALPSESVITLSPEVVDLGNNSTEEEY